MGVMLPTARALTSAPRSSSSSTTGCLLARTAKCSGVSPDRWVKKWTRKVSTRACYRCFTLDPALLSSSSRFSIFLFCSCTHTKLMWHREQAETAARAHRYATLPFCINLLLNKMFVLSLCFPVCWNTHAHTAAGKLMLVPRASRNCSAGMSPCQAARWMGARNSLNDPKNTKHRLEKNSSRARFVALIKKDSIQYNTV